MTAQHSPSSPSMGRVNPSIPGTHVQMHQQKWQVKPPTSTCPGDRGSCSSQGQQEESVGCGGVGLCGGPRIFLTENHNTGWGQVRQPEKGLICLWKEVRISQDYFHQLGEGKRRQTANLTLRPRCIIIELKTLIFCPTHYSYVLSGWH